MSIASDIKRAFSGAAGALLGMGTATLTKRTPGARRSAISRAAPPTPTANTCKAMVEATGRFRDGTLVKEGAAILLVLGGSLPSGVVPAAGDTVTLRGTVYRITRVISSPDPGGAAHQCEAIR